MWQRRRPLPDPTKPRVVQIEWPESCIGHVRKLFGFDEVNLLSNEHCWWIGGMPVEAWGEHAKEIVLALKAAGQIAWVPLGSQNLALGRDSMGKEVNFS